MFYKYIEYMDVGQIELINEIYTDNYLAVMEVPELLIR